MEALWTDLCQHEDVLPVHDWQKEILDGRERLIEKGEAQFLDWEEAKTHCLDKSIGEGAQG